MNCGGGAGSGGGRTKQPTTEFESLLFSCSTFNSNEGGGAEAANRAPRVAHLCLFSIILFHSLFFKYKLFYVRHLKLRATSI